MVPGIEVDGVTLIRDAIDAAEDVRDPLEDLVDRAKADAGAPYEDDAIELLRETWQRSPADYVRTIEKLRAAKVSIGRLEKLLNDGGASDDAAESGSITWPVDEPWPEFVDGEHLLDDVVCIIERHVVLPAHAAVAIALWLAFSHSLDLWQICPRLAFLSPEKRCGKTTALGVVQCLVPRPLPASNITPQAVFRTIEAVSPTLLIDEADTFLAGNDELRGVLNSGHNRAGAFAVRLVGDEHRPAVFSTWAAIVIAMIGKLPDTLHDRSIAVPLKRKMPGDVVERLRLDRTDEFAALRRRLIRWIEDNRQRLQQWDGEVPSGLHDRAVDNWRPLLTIADIAAGHWPETARLAAIALTDSGEDAESAGVLLLRDLHDLFLRHGDRLPTQTILDDLHEMDERPWSEWRKGKPISAPQLARLLKPFGIASSSIRLDDGRTPKGFKRESCVDAFSRYLPEQAATPPQAAENCEKMPDQSRHKATFEGPDVAARKQEKSQNSGACGVVAAEEGEGAMQEPDASQQGLGVVTRQKAWGTRL